MENPVSLSNRWPPMAKKKSHVPAAEPQSEELSLAPAHRISVQDANESNLWLQINLYGLGE
jgi:hypothetical protein